MPDDIQISVRRKKVHEIRFINIVVTLSYYDVTWKYFNEALRYLCKSELYDISDERNGLDKCGYVLCDNEYQTHPTATVSLDIADKKIYNISIRKKFCSDWCYGAFKFLSGQLPDEATWKVGVKYNTTFKLYPDDEKGCKGEICYEDECTTLVNIPENSTNLTENVNNNKEIMNPKKNDEDAVNQIQIPEKNISEKIAVHKNPNISEEKIDRIQSVINALDNLATSKKKDLNDVIAKVNNSVATKNGRKLIFMDEKPVNDQIKNISPNESCNDHLNKVLNSISEWFTDETRSYFISNEDEGNIEKPKHTDNEINIMPRLDSCDQVVIRRSIILRRIQSCATSIVADFGIDDNSFHTNLIKFMKTCKLSSHNILFSAKELKCLIVVLIDILLPKISRNATIVKEDSLKKYGIENVQYYEQILGNVKKVLDIDSNEPELKTPINSQGDV